MIPPNLSWGLLDEFPPNLVCVMQNNAQCRHVISHELIPKHLSIAGDSVYPCLSWLLTPFLSRPSAVERYNGIHTRTYMVVEQTCGVIESRFLCITLPGEVLKCSPANMADILDCCVLHNRATRTGPQLDRNEMLGDEDELTPSGKDPDHPGIAVQQSNQSLFCLVRTHTSNVRDSCTLLTHHQYITTMCLCTHPHMYTFKKHYLLSNGS